MGSWDSERKEDHTEYCVGLVEKEERMHVYDMIGYGAIASSHYILA